MSLLMDALRKAEQAKRQAQEGIAADPEAAPAAPPPSDPLRLEPLESSAPVPAFDLAVDAPPPTVASPAPVLGETAPLSLAPTPEPERPASRLPDLSPALSVSDDEFQDVMPAPKRVAVRPSPTPAGARHPAGPGARTEPVAASADAADRAAAGNLFAAKEAAKDDKPKGVRKGFAWVVGILTVLATAGIGGYFWWQLQPKSAGLAAPGALLAAATRSLAPPPAAPIAAPTAAVAPALPTAAPVATAESVPSPAAQPIADKPVKPAAASRPARSMPGPRDTTAEQGESTGGGVRITKSHLAVHPLLTGAYEALARNDLAQAREHYQKVLAADPHDLGALHGLAALAQRESRPEQAEYWFKQILVADPKDATAMAALAEMYGRANPAIGESKLRAIANAYPDAAAPQVALGNLLVAQARWSEAQQAYFNAYAQQPGNPDVLFNLAVCLEHLGKPLIARRYYTEAVQAARHQPAQFDRAVAEERLRALPAN